MSPTPTKNALASLLAQQGISGEQLTQSLRALESCGLSEHATDFRPLSKGMTNTSYIFRCGNTQYLLRLAGKGTSAFIDRTQEAEVYRLLAGSGITDHALYLDPSTGTKITEFVDNARACDPRSQDDMRRCMEHLRRFHEYSLSKKLQSPVIGNFDLVRKLHEYEEALHTDMTSRFPDYMQVRAKAEKVAQFIEKMPREHCLCHIDPVADNFLLPEGEVRLIDWEYAEMADPHLDIAMFCIYSGLERAAIDRAMFLYFGHEPTDDIRLKIYAYVGLAGLLWTVWCELRRENGAAYDEYEEIQYGYPRKYFDLVLDGEVKA
ncbi:MAG: phosphotransferase [Actinomycetaceae bacterium]|nr:phosphotransferase [Actinomycetaceae bacterium]